MAHSTHTTGHEPTTRLHEDLPHYSEFHIKHPPIWHFHANAAALALLLVLTVYMYTVDLNHIFNGLNLIVALIIAAIKATLVVLIFMNVRGATKLTVLWAALGFIWLLLMGGIFMDYRTRPESPGWQAVEFTVQNASPNTVKEVAPEQAPANP